MPEKNIYYQRNNVATTILLLLVIACLLSYILFPASFLAFLALGTSLGSVAGVIGIIALAFLGATVIFSIFTALASVLGGVVVGIVFVLGSIILLPFAAALTVPALLLLCVILLFKKAFCGQVNRES